MGPTGRSHSVLKLDGRKRSLKLPSKQSSKTSAERANLSGLQEELMIRIAESLGGTPQRWGQNHPKRDLINLARTGLAMRPAAKTVIWRSAAMLQDSYRTDAKQSDTRVSMPAVRPLMASSGGSPLEYPEGDSSQVCLLRKFLIDYGDLTHAGETQEHSEANSVNGVNLTGLAASTMIQLYIGRPNSYDPSLRTRNCTTSSEMITPLTLRHMSAKVQGGIEFGNATSSQPATMAMKVNDQRDTGRSAVNDFSNWSSDGTGYLVCLPRLQSLSLCRIVAGLERKS